MHWKGNKRLKTAITNDGYHLKAEYIKEFKYSWIVYKNNQVLYDSIAENKYGESMESAKKKACRHMIKHLKQTP